MINEINRHPLRKYFYGSKGPMILATLGTVILFLYGLISGNEEVIIPLIVIDLLIALVWWFVGRVVVSSSVESF